MILLLIIRKLVMQHSLKFLTLLLWLVMSTIGFVTVQEKDADTIASIVRVLKVEGATKYGYSNSRTKAAFEKNVAGTFNEGEFIVLVYEK